MFLGLVRIRLRLGLHVIFHHSAAHRSPTSFFNMAKKLLLIFFLFGIVGVALGQDNNLEYGNSCSRTGGGRVSPKDIKNPIQCSEATGRCECESGLFYNEALNRCVSPPSGLCTTYSRDGLPIRTCTDFATCWPNEKHDPAHSRQNGTCYCEPDAKEDPHTGLCKLTFGSTRCVKLNDCDVNSLVTCRYGRCGCQDEANQRYNETSMRCESLVGGSCGVKSDSKLPFPAAVCHGPNMKCEEGKCACETGYARSHDKMCIKLTEKTHICQESHYGGHGFAGASFNMHKAIVPAAPPVPLAAESSEPVPALKVSAPEVPAKQSEPNNNAN